MERLSTASLRSLLAFLDECAALDDPATFPPRILAGLRRLIPCDITSYNELGGEGERIAWVAEPRDAGLADYGAAFEAHAAENPLIEHARQTGGPRAQTISDFLSQRQWQQLGLYSEFFRPLGVNHQLAITLPAPRGRVVGLALSRADPDFGDDDRTLLNLVQPHLIQTYRTVESLSLLQRGLDEVGQTGLVVARDGRVRSASHRTWQLVAAYSGPLGRCRDRLPDALDRWLRQQQTRRAAGDIAPPSPPLQQTVGTACLLVRFVPGGPNGEHDLVLLEDRPSAPAPAALTALGLTRREAEILAGAAAGRTNAAIAHDLSLSERTIETHTKHILAKLGVPTRVAAVARAWQSVVSGWWLVVSPPGNASLTTNH